MVRRLGVVGHRCVVFSCSTYWKKNTAYSSIDTREVDGGNPAVESILSVESPTVRIQFKQQPQPISCELLIKKKFTTCSLDKSQIHVKLLPNKCVHRWLKICPILLEQTNFEKSMANFSSLFHEKVNLPFNFFINVISSGFIKLTWPFKFIIVQVTLGY